MEKAKRAGRRLHPGWWTAMLLAAVIAFFLLCPASFAGTFRSFVPVTLISERAGLVMESGAKVKMRGVQVGRVAGINGGKVPISLKLDLYPDQIRDIPAGAVLRSRNVSTEVETVFQNLVDVLHQIDPPKLNAVLTALADGVRGQGAR